MAVRVGRQIPRGQGNDRKDSLINEDFFVPNFSYCPVWATRISHGRRRARLLVRMYVMFGALWTSFTL